MACARASAASSRCTGSAATAAACFCRFATPLPGTTFGGGRYLLDGIKGADLGMDAGGRAILDFNFAYNPSCAYSARWICPLAPPENELPVAITAGERHAA